ncbi:MAG: RNA polymerase sigma factor [Candidatus Kapaibacterium sp.]
MNGDDGAFITLFRKHNQRLHMYCLKIVGTLEQAEDITQEMWERVIQLRAEPRQVYNPLGFFLTISRNLCLDHLRKRKRHLPFAELDESVHAAGGGLTELEETAVALLDQLPFEYREVLVLNLYCGYRFDEIAAMMGKSPEAIWTRASRGRAQLRRMIATTMESGESSAGSAGQVPKLEGIL